MLLAEVYSDFMIWTRPSSMPNHAKHATVRRATLYQMLFFLELEMFVYHDAASKGLFYRATAGPESCTLFC